MKLIFIPLLALVLFAEFVCAQSLVLDDFSKSTSHDQWIAGDKAVISNEDGVLRAEFPAYIPDDSARWPSAARSVGEINLGQFNGLRAELTNPTDLPQPLQISFKDSAGRRAAAVATVPPKSTRTIHVDFQNMGTGSVDWTAVEEISFYRTEPSHVFVWKIHRVELYTDHPDTTTMGQLDALLIQTRAALDHARGSSHLSKDQISAATRTIEQWTAALGKYASITGKSQQCRNELSAVHSMLLAASLADKAGGEGLLAWTVPVGTAFRPGEALSDYRERAEKLTISAGKGEYEDVIVRLTNLTQAVEDLRIEVWSDNQTIGKALSLRRNQSVRAQDESIVGDVLVPLDEMSAVTVGASETVELWLRLDRKHFDLPNGDYSARLRIRNLRSGGVTELPVAIRAWGFDYANAKPLRMTLYTGLSSIPQYRIIHGKEEQAFENMVDYGVNVFTLWPDAATKQVPYPKLTAQGDLAEPIDYTQHDRAIAFFRQNGNRPFFKMCLNFDVKSEMPNWTLRNNLEPGSDAWKKGLRVWFTDWTRHLQSLGLSTGDYAFYLTDEPDTAELDRYRLVGGIIKEIDPKIQIFINGSELYADEELNRQLMAVTDIWNPNEAVALLANPDLLPELRKYGKKEIWVYECKTGVRSRAVDAYDYYRLMTWRALRDGLVGVGYWHYCYQAETSEDPFDGTTSSSSGVFLVYPGQNKLLMSVRWELAREALEDAKLYRMIQQLPPGERRDALLGKRFADVIDNRNNPALATQWRNDAGTLLDESQK
ncbi:MAG: DUF4091 domain-containing protein [Phycisphaerales bacterium]|nr:DUF4091 domain-containing protein [Phycisphaerales bacterium]